MSEDLFGEKPAQPVKSAYHWAEEIYQCYPRKVAKTAALTAIRKALKDQDPEWLKARVIAYAKERATEDPKFTPHPATWFNQGRYLDEKDEPKKEKSFKQMVGPLPGGWNTPPKIEEVDDPHPDPLGALKKMREELRI